MNILHLRYAIEVERTRSISKAAENLFMNQSNLSRAIRELEQSLGVTLFQRTSKGMTPTVGGEEFLAHAKRIVAEIDRVEALYKQDGGQSARFALSAPRSAYLQEAFADFAAHLPEVAARLCYKEANAQDTVRDLLQTDLRLGIIRYPAEFDGAFQALLHEKDLHGELIAEHLFRLTLSAGDPLASAEEITPAELADYTEIGYPDPYIPSLSLTEALHAEQCDFVARRIDVLERGSCMELLSKLEKSFAFTEALSEEQQKRYGLVQKKCAFGKVYRDLLVYRKGYRFTANDRRFSELVREHAARLAEEE